jgi:hypothetical protein
VLEDPLLRFWFRFVFPNLSFIQQMGPGGPCERLFAPNGFHFLAIVLKTFAVKLCHGCTNAKASVRHSRPAILG